MLTLVLLLNASAGTQNELPSPVLDATNMREFLIDMMGFPAEEIFMLVDDGDEATEENFPSKENIEVNIASQPLQYMLIIKSSLAWPIYQDTHHSIAVYLAHKLVLAKGGGDKVTVPPSPSRP